MRCWQEGYSLTTAARTEDQLGSLATFPVASQEAPTAAVPARIGIWDSDVNQVVVIVAPPECISILGTVLKPLMPDLPAAVLILVHGHTERNRPLAVNLNKGRFPVDEGKPGSRLRNGHALIVQANEFLGVGKLDRLRVSLPVTGHKNQSILLRSLASRYGGNLIAVVLAGLEPAEAEAIASIRIRGGRTIALNDSDRGWLNEQVEKVVPDSQDRCLPAELIGAEIAAMVATRAA